MRLPEFLTYFEQSAQIGDIDPQNACLKYVSNRFELNTEQRFWLAFLFGCTYCAPTVFYIYNEFPDFENVDTGRLQNWWDKNKSKLLFQSDRLRVKTQNLFVPTFVSYRSLIGLRTQEQAFYDAAGARGVGSRKDMYRAAWDFGLQIRNFGRFTMFIYLELIHELTQFKMTPDRLEVSEALSSRNGLCYALDLDGLIDAPLTRTQAEGLEESFKLLLGRINAKTPATAWSLETALCAYKKHCRGKRWVGYYLDRQYTEISRLEASVSKGVCWDVLWQYRREIYGNDHLVEYSGKMSSMEQPYRT